MATIKEQSKSVWKRLTPIERSEFMEEWGRLYAEEYGIRDIVKFNIELFTALIDGAARANLIELAIKRGVPVEQLLSDIYNAVLRYKPSILEFPDFLFVNTYGIRLYMWNELDRANLYVSDIDACLNRWTDSDTIGWYIAFEFKYSSSGYNVHPSGRQRGQYQFFHEAISASLPRYSERWKGIYHVVSDCKNFGQSEILWINGVQCQLHHFQSLCHNGYVEDIVLPNYSEYTGGSGIGLGTTPAHSVAADVSSHSDAAAFSDSVHDHVGGIRWMNIMQ